MNYAEIKEASASAMQLARDMLAEYKAKTMTMESAAMGEITSRVFERAANMGVQEVHLLRAMKTINAVPAIKTISAREVKAITNKSQTDKDAKKPANTGRIKTAGVSRVKKWPWASILSEVAVSRLHARAPGASYEYTLDETFPEAPLKDLQSAVGYLAQKNGRGTAWYTTRKINDRTISLIRL